LFLGDLANVIGASLLAGDEPPGRRAALCVRVLCSATVSRLWQYSPGPGVTSFRSTFFFSALLVPVKRTALPCPADSYLVMIQEMAELRRR
jgi:hypothetical protein